MSTTSPTETDRDGLRDCPKHGPADGQTITITIPGFEGVYCQRCWCAEIVRTCAKIGDAGPDADLSPPSLVGPVS